ncbi:acylase [bacterium]|nr:acylase [bacterium]
MLRTSGYPAAILAAGTILAGCATAPAPPVVEVEAAAAIRSAPTYAASIIRTDYGVPHITAETYAGLGFGIGYAAAEDNICEIAERTLTVSGERALHFGAGERDQNLISDVYHRALIASGETERLLNGPAESVDTPSPEARAIAKGYAAGVSRFIRDKGVAGISDPRCKGADWVREIDEIDYWRHVYAGQVLIQAAGIASASPPDQGPQHARAADDPMTETLGLGSNAYALGREATKSGRGMLLGNPHYPWEGQNRFYRIHLTIPGELNVVGAGLVTNATVGIGHTDAIAWTHTVSTARRFGYFELSLDPADPTRYMYEGQSVPMDRVNVTVGVKTDEGVKAEKRVLFQTRFGPVLETEGLPWTKERAFAIRIMPQGLRTVDQYLGIWKARSAEDLRATLQRFQATGFNTTAVDAGGTTFFGDMGMIPNVSEALVVACSISDFGRTEWTRRRIPVLDGSRAACDWATDPDSTARGVMGGSRTPQLVRTDYMSQSNDSHWLTNPNEPLTGFSPIVGDEAATRSLRTRLSLKLIEDRLSGADGFEGEKFDLTSLQQVMFNNRHLGGEMVRDDLVAACRKSRKAKLAPACDALARWDMRVNLDSRGAHLFHLFAEAGGIRFKVPFDPADPVNTPHTLDVTDPAVLTALEKAVDTLNELEIPLDAPLGAVQRQTRGDARIPIHGGAGPEGVFNVISVGAVEPKLGWTSIRHGSSWVMAVEFTDEGPVSAGVLTYSQSTDPTSPFHADQTRLYSRKGWDDLRFSPAAVEAGAVRRYSLAEGAEGCAGTERLRPAACGAAVAAR